MLTKYSSYDDIVKTWGFEIINTAMIGDYSGDFVAVLYTQGVYGLFVHGYGSCSGCDELLGCETEQDVVDLSYYLRNTIRPYPDFESLKNDSLKKDGRFWYMYDKGFEEFLNETESIIARRTH
mgnify:FL=1